MPSDASSNTRLLLREGWAIQSSSQVKETGDVLSSARFKPKNWYPASMPATVLAALVANRVYPDPYFGMNLRKIPGTEYPIGRIFANLPMPADSPFRVSWWYRTSFRLPAAFRQKTIWLNFDGINYRANIWLNGHRIADAQRVAGTFRLYQFDVTETARPGEENSLAVEIFPPQPDDLAYNWVDWNPAPPDKDMGIWRDVYLTASGPVALKFPQVITQLGSGARDLARLTVNADLVNTSDHKVRGTLRGQIENIRFSQNVELSPQETRTITFSPDQFPQLKVIHPRLWWPAQLGPQNLYDLSLEFETGGQITDRQSTRFGIREITSEVDEKNHRLFKINGKKILIRGGGWAPDMLLRQSPERLEAELQYVRDMNLNTVRLEGKLETDRFFDLADRYGILVMAGWCCCDHWEHWEHRPDYPEGPVWKPEDYDIAAQSQRDQIRRLRNHPSLLVWLNGSDNPPPPTVEQTYINILKECRWPNPYLSSATARPTTLTGPTGVKMSGPYEWVPPSYWSLDKRLGGAHGFNTETSPGPAVPPIESLRKMLPKEHLWPIDEYWNYHAGGGKFKTIEVFTAALNARYGTATDVEDYAEKAQLMTYESERAMFEAYAGNKYTSTGVIQWMLNNAWPSLIWHLYDYYLIPAGGYFGTKKGCEPVHIQYSYDGQSIIVVNSTSRPLNGLKAIAKIYDLNLTEKFSKEVTLDLPEDIARAVFEIPELKDLTTTYFLKLDLENSAGQTMSSNFYWLSTQPDVLDWEKSNYYVTPVQAYADFTALKTLPPVKLNVSGRIERRGEENIAHVRIANPSRSLAFFIHLQITGNRGGEEVRPILWQDNYFTLMPGEKRGLSATYHVRDLKGARPTLVVGGWNIVRQTLGMPPATNR